MKRLAFAAALLFSTAAVAQTTMPESTMPATAPAVVMAPMTPPPAPMTAVEYPPCSRTVVDQCRQSSAREADYRGGPPANRRARRR